MKQRTVLNMLLYILGMSFNLALMVLVAFAVYRFTLQGFAFGADFAGSVVYEGEDYDIIFVLEDYTSLAEVARRLEEQGIIHNQHMFRLEQVLMNRTADFRPGTFTLNRSLSNSQITARLRFVPPVAAQSQRIMIPEGWTIAQMAAYFEERGFFPAQDFIDAAQYGDFNFSFLHTVPHNRPNRLEGYLFPDTYDIPMNPTPNQIIHRMLIRFDQIFTIEFQERADELGLTVDEIVIMASMIERETRLAHERALVSQVIHNRLNPQIWPTRLLQFCSTVAYVLDVHRDVLTYADLEIDSPHNTYRHPGLPIGPIANPGRASLYAALWPAQGGYLFFVLQDVNTGAHYFSTTFAAHQRARPQTR